MQNRERTISLTGQADCIRRQMTLVRGQARFMRPSEIEYEVRALEAILATIVWLQRNEERLERNEERLRQIVGDQRERDAEACSRRMQAVL